MESTTSHASVSKDFLAKDVKSTTMNANLSPVKMEEPVPTKSMTLNVTVSLATPERGVKSITTNANHNHARTEQPA